MNMYKCMVCDHLFEDGEEREWKEEVVPFSTFGRYVYEEWVGCPLCGGAFKKARACEICGSYQNMEEGAFFCNTCVDRVQKKYTGAVDRLLNDEFSESERELLDINQLL